MFKVWESETLMLLHCKFTAEFDTERILKIGQHVATLWTTV